MAFRVKVNWVWPPKMKGGHYQVLKQTTGHFFQSHFITRFCLFRQTEQFRGSSVFWQCSVKAWVKGEELWKKIRIEFQHTAEQSAYRCTKLLFERTKSAGGVLFAEATCSICETCLSMDTRVCHHSSLHITLMIGKQGQNKHVNVYGLPVYLTPQHLWWATFMGARATSRG